MFGADTAESRQLLLTSTALNAVIVSEKAHEAAILALGVAVAPRVGTLEPMLRMVFAQRLALIDEEIARCREASRQNPQHVHPTLP